MIIHGKVENILNKPLLVNEIISAVQEQELEDALKAGTIGFMPVILTQTTLPHSKLVEPAYHRINGSFTLSLVANPLHGLPYGKIPRSLMAYITTQAVKQKDPYIDFGTSLSQFFKLIGVQATGGKNGTISRFYNQSARLFNTIISFQVEEKTQERYHLQGKNMNAVQEYGIFWSKKSIDQGNLFNSYVKLNADFYESLINRPVPIDLRVYKCFQSSMSIDIYTWLTYRLSYLEKPTNIAWEYLQLQFGANYPQTPQGRRNFKKKFIYHLKQVSTIYKDAKVKPSDIGLFLRPSRPHIAKK